MCVQKFLAELLAPMHHMAGIHRATGPELMYTTVHTNVTFEDRSVLSKIKSCRELAKHHRICHNRQVARNERAQKT